MKKLISLLLAFICTAGIFTFSASANAASNSYESQLLAAGFPAAFAEELAELKKKYPNWEFEPMYVGVELDKAVANERTPHSQQLIQRTSSNNSKNYYCTCSSCYRNGNYVIQEGSTWVSASASAVEYYMNPLNFLSERYIFQFETTAYNSAQTISGIETIIRNTWMYNSYITYKDSSGKTQTYKSSTYPNGVKYSQAILDAAKSSGTSAYYLASRIVQEVGGRTNSAGGASGTNSTYPGIYNYYNIGANTGYLDGLKWAATSNSGNTTNCNAILRQKATTSSTKIIKVPKGTKVTIKATTGVQSDGYKWYQVSVTVNSKSYSGYIRSDLVDNGDKYNRPWTNPYLSIINGAKYISNNFSDDQNTGYLQKFNVNPESSNMYSHEYMANIQAPSSESSNTYNAYSEANLLSAPKTFIIPVFADQLKDTVNVVLNYTSYEYTGSPLGPGLKVYDGYGNLLTYKEDYTIKYNGQRTLPGTYSVTVTFIGAYADFEPITKEFEITESKVTVKLNYDTYQYTGSPLGPGLTVTDSKGNVLTLNEDYTVKYNDERIQPGTYSVTVTLKGNYYGTIEKEFKIVESFGLVTLNYTSYEYTGNPMGPGLKAYDRYGNLLTYKEDYTIKYNGTRILPGTYSVTVTFIGDYDDYRPVTREFTVTENKVNVKLNYTVYQYTGRPMGPGLTVTDSKGNVLTLNKDYTIKYNGTRIDPGTYSVTVTLQGSYYGTAEKEFSIIESFGSVTLNYTSYEYTGNPMGPGLKAYDKNGNLLTYKEDYTVKYNGTRIQPGTYSVTVTFIGNYSDYAPITREFEITESKVTVKLNYTSYEYTGRPMGPGLTVTDSKGNVLTLNKDYTVKYNGERIQPGTYSVTVTLKGNYVGTVTSYFKIVAA